MVDVEAVRQNYKPSEVCTLFVGESVPFGGTFFYHKDSKLFNATQKAFVEAENNKFRNDDDFLSYFKEQGFYLDDLIPEPVNQMNNQQRQLLRNASVRSLTDRLNQYKPDTVVIVMRAIQPMVSEAISQAGLRCETHCTPFPSHGNQTRFHNAMIMIIPKLKRRGI